MRDSAFSNRLSLFKICVQHNSTVLQLQKQNAQSGMYSGPGSSTNNDIFRKVQCHTFTYASYIPLWMAHTTWNAVLHRATYYYAIVRNNIKQLHDDEIEFLCTNCELPCSPCMHFIHYTTPSTVTLAILHSRPWCDCMFNYIHCIVLSCTEHPVRKPSCISFGSGKSHKWG